MFVSGPWGYRLSIQIGQSFGIFEAKSKAGNMDELGWYRYVGEVKETAALAIFYGTMALPSACIGIAAVTTLGQDWDGDSLSYPLVVLLLANLTQVRI